MKLLVIVMLLASAGPAEAKKRKRAPRTRPPPVAEPVVPEAVPEPVPEPEVAPEAALEEIPLAAVSLEVPPVEAPAELPSELELSIGAGIMSRSLDYQDDIFDRFLNHAVTGPVLTWDSALFPFRKNLGLVFRGYTAVGLETTGIGGVLYDTSAYSAQGGVSTRLRLGRFDVALELLLGRYYFGVTNDDVPPLSGVVSTTYTYFRPEARAEYELLDGLSVFAGGGYMYVFSTGELEDQYFDSVDAGGIGGSSGVSYELGDGFEARAALDYRRFFLGMSSAPGDRFVLGGATDQSYGMSLSLSYRM